MHGQPSHGSSEAAPPVRLPESVTRLTDRLDRQFAPVDTRLAGHHPGEPDEVEVAELSGIDRARPIVLARRLMEPKANGL